MDILVSPFIILIAVICLLIYFLRSNDSENSSIPYVKHESYIVVGHLFSFLHDRTKFLIECHQKYGQCFKIRILNQCLTFIVSPTDWTAILRNQSFYFPLNEQALSIFDLSNNFSGKCQYSK
jgi:hypothetical protein